MERVTMAEAARQLNANRSTISRWIKKNPALKGADGLVDVRELREHRETTIDPSLQTNLGSSGDLEPRQPKRASDSLNDHKARSAKATAIEAELDLAERLGQTLRKDEVERTIADAVEVMKQTGTQLAKDEAERLANIDDPRGMERALDDLMRDLFRKMAHAFSGMSGETLGSDAP